MTGGDGVHGALVALRGCDTVAAAGRRATVEVCGRLGFARAAMFAVDAGRLVPIAGHPAEARVPEIDPSEAIRRRRPLLLAADGRIAVSGGATAAAPLMPEADVIGLLQVDHGPGGTVTLAELDVLAGFAEGFGYALTAIVLRERLRRQAEDVGEILTAGARLADELMNGVGTLAWRPPVPDVAAAPGSGTLTLAPTSRARDATGSATGTAALTPRERQVIALIAAGETNSEIAGRLGVSGTTVKSHVKHILAKLGSSNRAEAVSRYLRVP